MSSLLPPVLRDDRGLGFEAALNLLLAQDPSALAVNLPLQAPAAALPVLAQVYHCQGLEGWDLAQSEIQRRVLLQGALLAHKLRGTPAGIRAAFAALGWTIRLEENLPSFVYDGSVCYDGSRTYTAEYGWGMYRVHVDLSEEIPFDASTLADFREVFQEQTPARCTLDSIRPHLALVEAFPRPTEGGALGLTLALDADVVPFTHAPVEDYEETSVAVTPAAGYGACYGWAYGR